MMTTTVKSIIFVVVLALIAGGAFLLIGNSGDNSTEQVEARELTQPVNDSTTQDTVIYTTQDVAAKNTEQECWTIIDEAVYDITSYIPRHPGGDEILLACGTDGSTLFNQRQTSTGEIVGSGTPHNSSAANQLNTFFIGFLEN